MLESFKNGILPSKSKKNYMPYAPIIILILFLLLSWLLIFNIVFSTGHSLRGSNLTPESPEFEEITKQLLAPKYNKPHTNPFVKAKRLIVVAGHAVLRLSELHQADTNDIGWYLLPYQLNQGFPAIIKSHIIKGIELTNNIAESLLIFSGGQTRKDVGPLSEAASYYYLADIKGWMENIKTRVFLEEFAKDSFENLLFAVCRFYEVTGTYPEQITVVGFDFKGPRFTNLHRRAIGFPYQNFTYAGVTPENFDIDNAKIGELKTYEAFRKDPYGCQDIELSKKKASRNPFYRTSPYDLACPDMRELLHYCSDQFIEKSHLPWYNR